MSYRSAIFYTSDEQRRTAEETIADVDASGLWPEHVVTEVAPAGDFWEAEPGHQDYLERIPHGYRSEEHTSELQSLMRISYAVFCLKKKNNITNTNTNDTINMR